MSDAQAKAIEQRHRAAEVERTKREGLWRELQHVVQPTSLKYEEEQGTADARERRLLDSTAAESLELFASFLMSEVFLAGTTDAAFRFVAATPVGRPLNPARISAGAKQWMEDVAFAVTASLFTGERSAVMALHSFCLDLGLYGSACMAAWRNPRAPAHTPITYRHYPVWQVAADMADGLPLVVYLKDVMSRHEAMIRWPGREEAFASADPESPRAVEALYSCISAEDPQLDRLVGANVRALSRPWYGVWTCNGRVLHQEAYDTKPVIFAPWYAVDNTAWGRSPSMTALGDVFMVNNLSEVTLRGAEKLVDPPTVVRDGALLSPLRTYPGGITYSDSDEDGSIRPFLPPGASRIEVGAELLRDRRSRIERAYFLPLFQNTNPTGSKQPRTAYEVALERDERNRAVAPMILRMMGLVLEPLIIRVVSLLRETGLIDPPPGELEGTRLLVQSNSPLVIALQQMRTAGLERWLQSMSLLSQSLGNLEVLDAVNGDRVARILHAAMNAPADALRDDQAISQLRQRRAEQQQAVASAEASAVNARAAADVLTAANKAGILGQ